MPQTYNKHPEEYRKHAVAQFREEWMDKHTSMQAYAKQACVHHTTFRKWVERYDPELRLLIRSHRSGVDMPTSQGALQIVSESYQYDEVHQSSVMTEQPDNTMIDTLRHKIDHLEKENQFLKRCVAYWMQQVMPSEAIL